MKVTITFDFDLDVYNSDSEESPATIEDALDDIKSLATQVYGDPKEVGITNIQITHD